MKRTHIERISVGTSSVASARMCIRRPHPAPVCRTGEARARRSNPRPKGLILIKLYVCYPLTHPTGAAWCPWPPVCHPPSDSSQFVCSWPMQPSPPPMKYTPSCCRLPPCKTSRRLFTKHPSREKERQTTPLSRAHTHHPKHRWISTHDGRIVVLNGIARTLGLWFFDDTNVGLVFCAATAS